MTYNILAKKYGLPDFDELDSEFEISTIEESDFFLREIRKKMLEKIDHYIKILEYLLKPEMSLADLYECKIFSDKEKEEMYHIFRKLMYYSRYSDEISLDENDKLTAKFISDLWKDWSKLKKPLKNVLSKLKQSWLDDSDSKSDIIYLG